jgi:hypothetical protein
MVTETAGIAPRLGLKWSAFLSQPVGDESMAHDIRLIRLKDFLRTDDTGTIDLQSSKRALKDLAAACAAHANHHVLIDVREATSKMSAVEVWELARSLEECGLGRDNRIAIVNHPKDEFDRADFFEWCASNRGYYFRAFRDFENALFWLAADQPAK